MRRNLLEVKNLYMGFQMKEGFYHAIEDISFNLEDGEILGIVGESGCGKSITSLSIMGLLPDEAKITEGEILFQEDNILEYDEKQMRSIRGNKISMIFQEPMTSLNPVYKVGKQISESLILHKGLSENEAKKKSIEMMTKVGLPQPERIYNVYPHELSGGMRQRIMIAMALVCNPKLIIADEPTTALDVTIQAQILDLMKSINKNIGTTIIIISHDIGVISNICSRVIVMYSGQIVEIIKAENMLDKNRHPYTMGLIASIPSPQKKGKELYMIQGRVPSITEKKQGCRYAPRCPYAFDRCSFEMPNIYEAEKGHYVRCFLLEKKGAE